MEEEGALITLVVGLCHLYLVEVAAEEGTITVVVAVVLGQQAQMLVANRKPGRQELQGKVIGVATAVMVVLVEDRAEAVFRLQ